MILWEKKFGTERAVRIANAIRERLATKGQLKAKLINKCDHRIDMKCLEIIELRTAESNRKILDIHMKKLIDDVVKEMSRDSIKAYFRVMSATDYSIHLFHDSVEGDKNGSKLGLHLVSTLKEFGLVNHSVWTELGS